MARVDYAGLALAIQTVLQSDPNLRNLGVTVDIAQNVIRADTTPHINIFEDRRTLTAGQPIAAGQRTRYTVRWQVTVSVFSGEGFADAGAQRDDVISYVETALMGSRNLGGALPDKSLMLQGGDLRSGKGEGGFWAEGTVEVSAEATAVLPA